MKKRMGIAGALAVALIVALCSCGEDDYSWKPDDTGTSGASTTGTVGTAGATGSGETSAAASAESAETSLRGTASSTGSSISKAEQSRLKEQMNKIIDDLLGEE